MRSSLTFAIPAILLLAACKSGSGVNFSVADIPVEYRQVQYAVSPTSTFSTTGTAEEEAGSIKVARSGSRVTNIEIDARQASIVFAGSQRGGDSTIETIGVLGGIELIGAEKLDGTAGAVFVDSFDHQIYGFWATDGVDPGSGGNFGVLAGGELAALGNLPVGLVNYHGLALGVYVDPDGDAFATIAGMDGSVHFGTGDVTMNTTGTETINLATDAEAMRPDLNLAGTATLDTLPGNTFTGTGTIATTGALAMSGDMGGAVYDGGNGFGGTYAIEGPGGKMMGSFGGAI